MSTHISVSVEKSRYNASLLYAVMDSEETMMAHHFRGAISQSDYNLSDPVMVCASACVHEQLWCNPVCTAR